MGEKLGFEVGYHAGVITAKAEGVLGFHTTPDFKRKLDAWIEPGVTQIILDLGQIAPIDSAGIASILQAIKMCQVKEIIFKLRNAPPPLVSVLTKSKITAVFES